MSGEAGLRSLEDTPTWAVATVCFVLISSSLLIEYALLLLSKYFNNKRRKPLFQALDKIKSELMMLGFISLLLTISERQIAKICVPKSVGETFLPCRSITSDGEEASKCAGQGKLSLFSRTALEWPRLLCSILLLSALTCKTIAYYTPNGTLPQEEVYAINALFGQFPRTSKLDGASKFSASDCDYRFTNLVDCYCYNASCTVTGLYLSSAGLKGELPKEIGKLTSLDTLSLAHNKFRFATDVPDHAHLPITLAVLSLLE
ncbi:hypothetical protein LOK49_LG06G02910 [Camellia lanceoleosa]|uniref:Uncharacterized protein n=1 Tax=Camellia lanceoleosa TaxID=1840588 RepID=A0ACC0HBL1_9ERIC|nr:hypothetical protein LOK49_LG06G02910 [Camellia lanceoleosa]